MISMLSALAASETIELQPAQSTQFGPLGTLTIPAIVSGVIRLSIVIAALAFFFMLVIGGIRWIVSGGDKAATEAARSQITSALIGLVIVFAAWAIVELINTFFGVSIFQLTIPTAGQ